jgi:hypothetical protein
VDKEQIELGINAGILLLLIVASIYLATKYGFIHCSILPHWCSLYSKMNTMIYGRVYPSVLLLYGDNGMGDPHLVERYIRNVCRYHIRAVPVSSVSLGNLQNYDVVIVEHARYLTAEQLASLWDFAAKGGRLVLIGDVGVDGPKDEFLTWKDLGEENKQGIVNRWDRKKPDGTIVDFGSSVLGLRYLGVSGKKGGLTGMVYFNEDMLTDGLPRSLELRSPFTATEITNKSVFGPITVAGVINDTKEVNGVKPPFPAVIRIGYRIIYVAYPPEEAGEDHMLLYFNLCEVVT